MTTWNGTLTFNEYASFVQAVRLDVCSVRSGSLIRFTRSLLLPYTSLSVTRNGTRKCLRKNWSQVTYLISDWNEKLKIHIWKEKVPLQLCSFLSSLLCIEKTLLYLFVEEGASGCFDHCACLNCEFFELSSTSALQPIIFCRLCAFCDYGCEEKLWGWAPCYSHAREGHALCGKNLRLSSSPCM